MASTPSSKTPSIHPRTRSVQDEQRPSRFAIGCFVGIGIAVTLLVASWLAASIWDSKLEISDVKIANSGEIALTGARYQGVTSSGHFSITADKASEANDGSGRIDMQQPRATITKMARLSNFSQNMVSLTSQVVAIWPGMLSSSASKT